ncbi:hypothetical protein [Umezakia ovalisporum]|uniref:Uncharacterized protein n=2 Tax=Umezakia ovalisporum TaxID=75695 RepID=A0AA43H0I7_9CYAN|nr:hypothetical protein [Umezakia ovalisporum]MDH6056615.1 hypothetical protein [Umezakia ovalisporum FSS-43]MDH6065091.1 hypothetical protein [Umezakia ovalisporum FSS-62]MDH6067280.1 hypothetical protein [Umezakia ovalisporum APH033B]MDH6070202.1 hypothetical protein [Umezakia ovalisporum CobakiLakeA]MDH6075967.1 hypothetical protein [Umezakia ovalisporum CS-1034]
MVGEQLWFFRSLGLSLGSLAFLATASHGRLPDVPPTVTVEEVTSESGVISSQVTQESAQILLGESVAPKQLTPERSVDQLRQELRVTPIFDVIQRRVYSPSASAGIPTAFGASWGDMFLSLAGSTSDNVRPETDGGTSLGFGLGNSRQSLGLEVIYNNLSIRSFAQNGSFDAKVHRSLFSNSTTQVAAAVGWNNLANYGNDAGGTYPSSVYGVVSAYRVLRPQDRNNSLPVTLSLGLGGAPFFSNSNSGVGVIAGAGIQVHPQIAVSSAWSGRGLNLGASFVPVQTIPLSVAVIYGDALDNTESGSVLAVGIGYSFNFLQR